MKLHMWPKFPSVGLFSLEDGQVVNDDVFSARFPFNSGEQGNRIVCLLFRSICLKLDLRKEK